MESRSCRIVLYLSFLLISSTHTSVAHTHNGEEGEKLDGRAEDKSAQEQLVEAFEEQGYYLQRLFLEYGTNGTLTYEGLQNLLGSLGLGEISVLEIHHGGVKHSSPNPSHVHHHPQPPGNAPANKPTQPETSKPNERMSSTGGSAEFDISVRNGDQSHPPALPPPPSSSSSVQPGFEHGSVSDHTTKMHLHENRLVTDLFSTVVVVVVSQCLNVTQLLWNFGLGRFSYITPAHFTLLCPALLYQIDSGVCLRHTESNVQDSSVGLPFLKALGWSSLALLVISVPSLVALGLVPLLPASSFQTLLCPMAAMAVSTLCGDALLHLLPHATSGPHGDHQDAVLKGLGVLAGLYLLFIFESVLEIRQHYKKLKKRKRNTNVGREMEALEGSPPPEPTQTPESGRAHSHGTPSISSMAWMVVMGDGIHNLTDGLAIGVAFSQSLTGGLSTTIAVFCHELPHELGDLALLLAAGWPVRRLLLFSVLSALLGFVGVLAGTFLGHQWAQHSPWILTLTAGVFLYVALADMMPEMLHGGGGCVRPLRRFVLQSAGLWVGGGVMLSVALFEDRIAVNLGDG